MRKLSLFLFITNTSTVLYDQYNIIQVGKDIVDTGEETEEVKNNNDVENEEQLPTEKESTVGAGEGNGEYSVGL